MSMFGDAFSGMFGFGKPQEPLDIKGALLVDVRTPEEFSADHFKGAINVPVSDLPRRLKALGPKNGKIILYCHSGMRARSAKQFLEGSGYTNVTNAGGLTKLRKLTVQS